MAKRQDIGKKQRTQNIELKLGPFGRTRASGPSPGHCLLPVYLGTGSLLTRFPSLETQTLHVTEVLRRSPALAALLWLPEMPYKATGPRGAKWPLERSGHAASQSRPRLRPHGKGTRPLQTERHNSCQSSVDIAETSRGGVGGQRVLCALVAWGHSGPKGPAHPWVLS